MLGSQISFAFDGVEVAGFYNIFVIISLPILIVVPQVVQNELQFVLIVGDLFTGSRLVCCSHRPGLAGFHTWRHKNLVYTRVSGRIVTMIDFAALTCGQA